MFKIPTFATVDSKASFVTLNGLYVFEMELNSLHGSSDIPVRNESNTGPWAALDIKTTDSGYNIPAEYSTGLADYFNLNSLLMSRYPTKLLCTWKMVSFILRNDHV